MQAFYERYGDSVAVVTVNIGESAEKVRAFLKEGGYSMPVLLDTRGEVARAYGVTGVPSTFFIDSQGRLAGYYPGLLTVKLLEDMTRNLD